MKTVTMPKPFSMTLTITPPKTRIHFVGHGRKRFSDKGRPNRAAQKRTWKAD
jgi:hypothetical protein